MEGAEFLSIQEDTDFFPILLSLCHVANFAIMPSEEVLEACYSRVVIRYDKIPGRKGQCIHEGEKDGDQASLRDQYGFYGATHTFAQCSKADDQKGSQGPDEWISLHRSRGKCYESEPAAQRDNEINNIEGTSKVSIGTNKYSISKGLDSYLNRKNYAKCKICTAEPHI